MNRFKKFLENGRHNMEGNIIKAEYSLSIINQSEYLDKRFIVYTGRVIFDQGNPFINVISEGPELLGEALDLLHDYFYTISE